MPNKAHWSDALDDRAKKELLFAENYVQNFNHGAVGHNSMNLIVWLKNKLDEVWNLKVDQGAEMPKIEAPAKTSKTAAASSEAAPGTEKA
jgi:hypothetical protein